MNAYYVLGTILNILCEIISFDPKKSYEVGSFIITQNKRNKETKNQFTVTTFSAHSIRKILLLKA